MHHKGRRESLLGWVTNFIGHIALSKQDALKFELLECKCGLSLLKLKRSEKKEEERRTSDIHDTKAPHSMDLHCQEWMAIIQILRGWDAWVSRDQNASFWMASHKVERISQPDGVYIWKDWLKTSSQHFQYEFDLLLSLQNNTVEMSCLQIKFPVLCLVGLMIFYKSSLCKTLAIQRPIYTLLHKRGSKETGVQYRERSNAKYLSVVVQISCSEIPTLSLKALDPHGKSFSPRVVLSPMAWTPLLVKSSKSL